MEETTRWSLRDMFPTDELWKNTMAETMKLVEALASRKGHLAEDASALLETAKQFEEIEKNLYALMVFANSNFDQNMADVTAKSLYETAQNNATCVGEKLSFMAPELMQYNMEDFEKYCEECPQLSVYKQFALDFFEKKEHVLSDTMEKMLVRMNDLGESFSKIFEDLTVNDMTFPVISTPNGEKIKASESNYRQALESSNREFRKEYLNGLLGTYGNHINTISSIYYGSVKNDIFTAKSRHYDDARSMALAANHIPGEVYDNLLQTIRSHIKPLHDYAAFRKKMLKVDSLHFYDLFVPIVPSDNHKYTYEEAQQLVLNATAVLGEDYTALVKKAFDERWIDVYPRDGKRSGAYSTGAYGYTPYILTNFTGTLDDVFTLAHELGHSMHTYFSSHTQPFVYADYSIFCAEVASTVNEQLLSEYLYQHSTSEKERALLLDKRLDALRSTFYRQAMFADFENQTHKLAEKGEPLVPDTLCEIHRSLNQFYYGPDFTVDDCLAYEWARIPHFYTAFYVYQYATGIAAATAIARKIFSEGAPAVSAYRKFLTLGGSRHPIDLLQVAGVNMASPEPILAAVETFEKTLNELKKII